MASPASPEPGQKKNAHGKMEQEPEQDMDDGKAYYVEGDENASDLNAVHSD
jgi:hypothetical protein